MPHSTKLIALKQIVKIKTIKRNFQISLIDFENYTVMRLIYMYLGIIFFLLNFYFSACNSIFFV